MKLSKEARIGLMVAISVLVLFAGFYFLRGSNVFSSENEYYANYDNVSGLQPSAAVQIKGLQIGKVSKIQLIEGNNKVKVTLSISKKTQLPSGTIAKLVSVDLLGTKGIMLDIGTGSDVVPSGAQLPSTIEGGLVDKLSTEVTPLLQDVRIVVNHVDSVLLAVNDIFSPQARDDLQKSISALHTSMDHFSSLSNTLDKQSTSLAHVINNADKITTNLANSNENIDKTLKNLKTTTDNLAQAKIKETMAKLESASDELNSVMKKINSGQGTIGLAVNNKDLYNNLTKTMKSVDDLMTDLKAHPAKYINVTVFGRKAKVGP